MFCVLAIFAKSVFLLAQKEHVPSTQNPFSQNPLVPILGEVSFIVLRPVSFFAILGINFGNIFELSNCFKLFVLIMPLCPYHRQKKIEWKEEEKKRIINGSDKY